MAASGSRYAQMMQRLSNRIFSEPVRPLPHKDQKVVKYISEKPLETSQYIKNYYPPHPQIWKLIRTLRDHGLFRDEHLDFSEEMERQRVLRGKVRPVRRQGKKEK